jgi:outer membrane protein assembly factor BamE (lipoprotein component of BamABCDE complex)
MKRAAGYVNRSCDARTSGLQERPSPDMTFRALAPSFRRTRSVTGTLRSTVAAMALGLVLVGCTGEQFQRGYILPPGALEQIQIGASQDQVLVVLGTPSTVATLDGDVFYYISQRTERKVAFMHQQVIDQRVIAVYFDKNRMVRRVANYGLKDGKIFDFISRTTPTGGQEISYLAPLFKLLRFRD